MSEFDKLWPPFFVKDTVRMAEINRFQKPSTSDLIQQWLMDGIHVYRFI